MKIPLSGEFEESVLSTVASLHDKAYGVPILGHLEKKLQKKINISAIHVSLKRMEEKGFVCSRFESVTNGRGGRRKKYYTITAIGKQVLDAQYVIRKGTFMDFPISKLSFG